MSKRSLSILFVALFVALFAVACSSSPEKPDTLVTEPAGPSFLELIPADTPYVFASYEPAPAEALLSNLDMLAAMSDGIIAGIGDMASATGDPQVAMIYSLLQELEGKSSKEGLESLGFSVNPRFAFYGIGVLPVYRIDLKDPGLFLEFLGRVEAKAGLTPQIETLGGVEYRLYHLGDELVAPVAVIGQELVMGVTPVSAQATYLPYMLGEKKPAKSFAQVNPLVDIASSYDLKGYGIGYLDIRGIAQMLLAPEPGLNEEILQAIDFEHQELTEACQTEMLNLIGVMPRAIIGYESFEAGEAVMFGGVELTNGLGGDLAQTKTAVPAWESGSAEGALLAGGFGIDVGKLLGVVRQRLANLRDAQFQCQELQGINQVAAEAGTYLQMVPPVVSQVQGLGIVLQDIEVNPQALQGTTSPAMQGGVATPPVTLRGLALLASADAVSLVDTLKLFVQQLAPITLKPDAQPTALPPFEGLDVLVAPHLVLSRAALALSSGEGMQEEAATLVSQPLPEATPWFGLTYDYTRLAQIFAEIAPENPGAFSAIGGGPIGPTVIAVEPDDRGLFMRFTTRLGEAPATSAVSSP